jgi:hypothetical protein
MQIVDHQHGGLLERRELGNQLLGNRRYRQLGAGCDVLDNPVQSLDFAQPLDDQEPEPLRISLTTVDGNPRHTAGESSMLDPRPKQDGFAASGRRRDEGHAAAG